MRFPNVFSTTPPPALVTGILAGVWAMLAYGLALAAIDPAACDAYIVEDGPIEWLTFAALAGMAAYCAAGSRTFSERAPKWTWRVLSAAFFFSAMEEISWGQRVLGFATPEWLLPYNNQGETTIHNLQFGSFGVNRVIFGAGLAIAMVAVLVALPIVYRRRKERIDALGVPVAQTYQIILFFLAAALVEIFKKSFEIRRLSELMEFAGCWTMATVLLHPVNAGPSIAWRMPRLCLPGRLRFGLAVVGLNLAIFTALRALFWAVYHAPAPVFSWWLGFKFDLRLALILFLPVAAVGWWLPRKAGMIYLVAAAVFALLMYVVDLGHYDYLRERLNAGLLEHMLPAPDVSARMVWQSYPVVWLTLALALAGFGYARLLRRAAFRQLDAEPQKRNISLIAAIVLLYGFGLYGKLSWYPLRWSEAYYSTDPFATALAQNPVLNFFDTWKTRKKSYDEARVKEHYAEIAQYLGVPEPAPLKFAREERPEPKVPGRPNIVIIFLESFAAFKTGVHGNPLDPTPEFDAVARQSLRFTNFYVPRPPTARSIFTTLFGIPDIQPGDSSSRNPQTVGQHTIVNAFAGYEKMYFIGGSASWGSIRAMLASNIPGLRLFEEGDFKSPKDDVWGISDLHLLEEAHLEMKKRSGPFIAFIQTAGNHRPYTMPADFKRVEPKGDLRENGFESTDAFNAIRFMDRGIGNFFELASKEAYFKNTIFVMQGDHGVAHPAEPPLERLRLTRNHVPLVLYAPGLIPPRVIDATASSVDVLPTVAGLAGVRYTNTTLGMDLLSVKGPHFAYVEVDENSLFGLVDGDRLLQIDPVGVERLYRLPSGTAVEEPERAARMARMCRGLRETARYMLYNNRPLK